MFPHFDQSEYAVALQNAYRQFPAKNSTLDIDFVNNRQRVAGVYGAALDGVTFTRSTTGTYFDSAGVLQTAAINAPRFEYDPVSLRPLGLLIEESRANILLNSDTGTTQSVTVSATAYTLSIYGTGTVTLSGVSTAGPLVGTGANTRVILTFTPTAGTLNLTVSGTVTRWQLEAGSFATNYIPTAGTTVTRGADVASMTGANFSSWYNQSAGSFMAFGSVDNVGAAIVGYLFEVDNNNISNLGLISVRVTAGLPQGLIYDANSVQAAINGSSYTAKNALIATVGYATDNVAASFNGSAVILDNSAAIPTVEQLQLGRLFNNSLYLNGHIARLVYYPKRLPNNLLQYITRLTA